MNTNNFNKKGYTGLIHTLDKGDKRVNKYLEQQKETMMDDTETWSLDSSICKFMFSRLTRYYELADKTIVINDEHRQVIEQMIEGFKVGADDIVNEEPENLEKTKLAFELLAKHHRFLWW